MKIYTSEMIKKVNIRNKKINFVLRFIYIPIIMLILALGATIFYQVLVLNKSNVEILGYKAYVVMSERTEPYLKNGDVVISKKILENDIKVGDIITFKSSNNRPIVTNMTLASFYSDYGDSGGIVYTYISPTNTRYTVGVLRGRLGDDHYKTVFTKAGILLSIFGVERY